MPIIRVLMFDMNNILYLANGDGKVQAERLNKKAHKVGYILRALDVKCDVISENSEISVY